MTMTGHGQGNTQNAAEFSEFTHHVWVDGAETFEQHLWKTDCGENDCSPQNGTWLYSRAGWCPGQDVQPWEWDLGGLYTPGEEVNLDFVLADYTNLNNTGYNGGSHTEPHYRCHTYLLQYSDKNIVAIDEQLKEISHLEAYPNPTNGFYYIKAKNEEQIKQVSVYAMNSQLLGTYFLEDANEYRVDLRDQANGVYFIKVQTNNYTTVLKTIKSN